jgi:hypothetical protein
MLADAKVKELLADKQVKKVIVVPGRLVNTVVGLAGTHPGIAGTAETARTCGGTNSPNR